MGIGRITRRTAVRQAGRTVAVLVLGMGTLGACVIGGGKPPTPSCDGDTAGGPDANGTIATAASVPFGDVKSCNDATGAPGPGGDVDLFKLPVPTGPGFLQVSCPTDNTVDQIPITLLNSAGTFVGEVLCGPGAFGEPPGPPVQVGVGSQQYYVEVDHSPNTGDATVPVTFTPAASTEVDPLAATLPATVFGTVGPGDLTDTITFTAPAGLTLFRSGCGQTVPYSISGTFASGPSTLPTTCAAAGDFSSAGYTAGTPVTVVVSAPAGATGPYAYVLHLDHS